MIFVFTGPTGCGKTYSAFFRNNKKRIVYTAPCRQLVYESALKYGKTTDAVKTSDIKIGSPQAKRIFATYESINNKDIRNCDVFIIDEAHFIKDPERGQHLINLILFANKIGKKVILLSATMDFNVHGAKVIDLPARGSEFKKEAASYEECLERARDGVPTLIFHARKDECGDIGRLLGIKSAVITADTPVYDRVRLVKLFNKGVITLMEATNAMAQGVNVPAENIINIHNGWDKEETLVQKFGRLGRTGVTKDGARLTYYFNELDKKSLEEAKEIFKSPSKTLVIKKKKEGRVVDYDLKNPDTIKNKKRLERAILKTWEKK